jgi:hypothetical protein
MRVVVFFAPAFLKVGVAFMKRLQEKQPGTEIIAIAMSNNVYETLKRDKSCNFKILENLEAREREWVSEAYDPEELKNFTEKFGARMMSDVLILDRQVGDGFVSGAYALESELTLKARDPDVMRAYMTNMTRYFVRLYDEQKPDAVYLYAIAGAPMGAAAWIAQAQNIAIMSLAHTRVDDRLIIDSSIRWLMDPLWERFGRGESASSEHMERAKSWVEDFRSRDKKPGYFVFNSNRNKSMASPLAIVKKTGLAIARSGYYLAFPGKRQLRADTGLYRLKQALVTPLRAYKAARFAFADYEALKDKDFIYFAMHVDPEAATMHLAPDHTNQLTVLEALAKRRPLHMNIMVKEHAPMLGRRPKGFYEAIRKLPGVYLVHPSISSRELIKNSKLVFSITGTVAWEALVLQKPAAMLGCFPFLRFATQLGQGLKLAKLETLPEDIEEAIAMPPVNDADLVRFLGLLYEETFSFPTELFWGKVTDDDVRKNDDVIEGMTEQFLRRVRQNPALRKAA